VSHFRPSGLSACLPAGSLIGTEEQFRLASLDLSGKIRLSQDWSVQIGKNSENSLSAYAFVKKCRVAL
jgi:hypothetical protein